MNWYFDNERPIYKQLIEQLTVFIISGECEPGSKLASVRDLALESKVNPNTMQRALQELESIGLIYTNRTNGKYVCDDNKLIEKIKKEMAKSNVEIFLANMAKLGIDKKETIKYLEEEIK